MLYDNALLMRMYVEGFQATGDPMFQRIVEETATYLLREMMQPGGGFYATQDADSEGEEGKYFVWTREEILGLLGEEKGALFCRYYGVEE
ncbi:MAG TPA: thioredoxin domain-containing protein, partial [Candidatus Latescibacteria bacterium]|nr:thioredoxin domain-containing protein [Candidatus Latescibacterota bacterium]